MKRAHYAVLWKISINMKVQWIGEMQEKEALRDLMWVISLEEDWIKVIHLKCMYSLGRCSGLVLAFLAQFLETECLYRGQLKNCSQYRDL